MSKEFCASALKSSDADNKRPESAGGDGYLLEFEFDPSSRRGNFGLSKRTFYGIRRKPVDSFDSGV